MNSYSSHSGHLISLVSVFIVCIFFKLMKKAKTCLNGEIRLKIVCKRFCKSRFVKKYFKSWIVYIHVSSVLHPLFLGALQPPVDQWNSVNSLAGLCIVSPVCIQNGNPPIKNCSNVATKGQKLHRIQWFCSWWRAKLWSLVYSIYVRVFLGCYPQG